MTRRGKFVAIEAMDAAGKQTQSRLLASALDAMLIAFPRYETEIGKAIRSSLTGDIAMAKWNGEWEVAAPRSAGYEDVGQYALNALVRQSLFTLDRYDAAPAIADALANGRNVVTDRFWLSGWIYGASDSIDAEMLERVHVCLPQPDVWLLLDVPVEESFRRRPARADVYERDQEKLADVRRRYLKKFQDEAEHTLGAKNLARHLEICPGCDLDAVLRLQIRQKWVVVDGVGTIEQVHDRIMQEVVA